MHISSDTAVLSENVPLDRMLELNAKLCAILRTKNRTWGAIVMEQMPHPNVPNVTWQVGLLWANIYSRAFGDHYLRHRYFNNDPLLNVQYQCKTFAVTRRQ